MDSVYQAARERAALVDRSSRGRIVLTGPDRASYLQGLFTNDIAALTPGSGCYTAYLTAQGRMIADLWVYEIGDLMLLTMAGELKETLLARLDQFLFSEDVQLGDVTDTFAQFAVIGPAAAAVLSGALDGVAAEGLARLPEHGNRRVSFSTRPAIVTRVTDTGEPGFDVYVEREQRSLLEERLAAAGVPTADTELARALRIEAGVPVFHEDMDEETIPLEANLESRAISLTKGCYVGQEVIVRVLHRGHGRVARRLVGLVLAGDAVPLPGTPIDAGDRAIGHVTSAVRSPALGQAIALGYVHRDFTAAGTIVSVDRKPARVADLPFVAR